MTVIYGDYLTQAYHEYMCALRKEPDSNIWAAAPRIREEFGVPHREAVRILMEWIEYGSGGTEEQRY